MRAAIAVPLIMGGVSAAASLGGAKIQSSAAKNAAKTQTDAAKDVQAYQSANTAQQLAFIQSQQGQPNTARPPAVYGPNSGPAGMPTPPPSLAQLGGMGTPPPSALNPSQPPPYSLSALGQARNEGSGQPVQMRGPDGSMAMVPPDRVDFMTSKGAVRV